MTSFYDTLKTYDWDDVKQNIMDKSKNDAIAAINNPHRTLDDFMALISPAATPLLEDMAVEANRLTLERFGNTIQLYIPLYVSNYCTNFCVYCGFNHDNDIHRKMLTLEEVQAETDVITGWGFKHLAARVGRGACRDHGGLLRESDPHGTGQVLADRP